MFCHISHRAEDLDAVTLRVRAPVCAVTQEKSDACGFQSIEAPPTTRLLNYKHTLEAECNRIHSSGRGL